MKLRTVYATLALLAPFATLAAEADHAVYASPQQLVDIGGRKLHLHCQGSGDTTVIFSSGSGRPGSDWALVQPEIAKRARACIYDRAGFGFSDASPRAGSINHAVDDLHALLRKAGLKPPFVLAGNSYGGMIVQQYAYRHPKDVAALVLLDAQHEDEAPRLDKLTNGAYTRRTRQLWEMDKTCLAQARKGFVAGSELEGVCVQGGQEPWGPALQAALARQKAMPKHWHASIAENSQLYDVSPAQLRKSRKPFGDMPLVVRTRGVSPYLVPGQEPSATNKAIEAANKTMQDEVAALSTRGSNEVVADAGHAIHMEKPDAAVRAVQAALDMLP
ncbi:alpha/beta hydrolase [Pseudoduganella sp.]|uniref:alpha/beta hydrolase n=1 Tax=Pseudoduganella sp. TaxID=1880898 RepID=UPI0035AFC926